jgi:hypothetical protein
MKQLNVAGKTFGKLTVVKFVGRNSQRYSLWLCRCSCGGKKTVRGRDLVHGRVKSCGCLEANNRANIGERTFKHGHATAAGTTKEYECWSRMIDRCYNPRNKSYKDYGGRGMLICPEWRESFAAFFAYMGKRPSAKHSIDRFPNNDGNYEPGNCRWATAKQQRANRRDSRHNRRSSLMT